MMVGVVLGVGCANSSFSGLTNPSTAQAWSGQKSLQDGEPVVNDSTTPELPMAHLHKPHDDEGARHSS
jgi:hypothetical protein